MVNDSDASFCNLRQPLMINEAANHCRIRPRNAFAVCGMYALCGAIALGLLMLHPGLAGLFALLMLVGMALFYPFPRVSAIGAIAFCWVPFLTVIGSGLAFGMLKSEIGVGAFVFVLIVAAAALTIPAICIAVGSAAFFSRYCEIGTPVGLCANCDYDLRGLPHDRCPECGQRAL